MDAGQEKSYNLIFLVTRQLGSGGGVILMKRLCLWIAVLLSVFTLCGCQNKEDPDLYDVDYGGTTYTVDREHGTITCDGIVYQFEVSSRGGDSVDLDITYPDGSRYYWTMDGSSGGHGGWSDDYDPEASGYVPGDVLWDVLSLESAGQGHSGPSPILAVVLLALGAFQALSPRTAWTLGYGWRFKDAEPSELALTVNRIVGVLLIFVGIICLLASL